MELTSPIRLKVLKGHDDHVVSELYVYVVPTHLVVMLGLEPRKGKENLVPLALVSNVNMCAWTDDALLFDITVNDQSVV